MSGVWCDLKVTIYVTFLCCSCAGWPQCFVTPCRNVLSLCHMLVDVQTTAVMSNPGNKHIFQYTTQALKRPVGLSSVSLMKEETSAPSLSGRLLWWPGRIFLDQSSLPLSGWWPSSSSLIFYVTHCKEFMLPSQKCLLCGGSWPNRCWRSSLTWFVVCVGGRSWGQTLAASICAPVYLLVSLRVSVQLTFQSLRLTLCPTSFNIQKFFVLPTMHLCVLCRSQNKQRLFLYTTLTDRVL
jgi:hypothetical protein